MGPFCFVFLTPDRITYSPVLFLNEASPPLRHIIQFCRVPRVRMHCSLWGVCFFCCCWFVCVFGFLIILLLLLVRMSQRHQDKTSVAYTHIARYLRQTSSP